MELTFLTKNVIPTGIAVKSAKGVKIWDENDKEYLDFSSGSPRIDSRIISDEQIEKQLRKFTAFSPAFHDDSFISLSQKLSAISPRGLKKVNLSLTTATDAIESAIARTRIYRKKPYIISFYWSNYGKSFEAMRASGKDTIGGPSYFIHLTPPFPQIRTESQVLQKIEVLAKSRTDIAGILLKPLMIDAGVYSFSALFLKALRRLCDSYKITLIFDENHTAFGRLGTLFAADYFDVTPDIITLGDNMALGFPLAGVLMKPEYDVLDTGFDERSFGGHPLSCSFAMQNLEFLERTHILSTIPDKVAHLTALLENVASVYKPVVSDVRVYGLIAGIECKTEKIMEKTYAKALQSGLLLLKSTEGNKKTLILKPPLIVSIPELSEAVTILSDCLEESL